jgi:hypothetical protein
METIVGIVRKNSVGNPVGNQIHRALIGLFYHLGSDPAVIVVVKAAIETTHGFDVAGNGP